jgi:hypothetical protein
MWILFSRPFKKCELSVFGVYEYILKMFSLEHIKFNGLGGL